MHINMAYILYLCVNFYFKNSVWSSAVTDAMVHCGALSWKHAHRNRTLMTRITGDGIHCLDEASVYWSHTEQ